MIFESYWIRLVESPYETKISTRGRFCSKYFVCFVAYHDTRNLLCCCVRTAFRNPRDKDLSVQYAPMDPAIQFFKI